MSDQVANTHLLSVEHVGMSYGDARVLDDVCFTLDAGESMSITSPSGSGKSTILSIAGLLLSPTSGTVRVDGVDMVWADDETRSGARQRTFGFIFQHTQLVGFLRAAENVEVPARFLEHPDFDVRQRSRELLSAFGLEHRVDHYPHQLSVGQKRRVAAARALLLDPQVVIADEPTNDLDAGSARSVADCLFEQVERGKALLLVTHDAQLAQRTQRQFELVDGKLVQRA